MRRSRLYSYQTCRPAVVTRVMAVRDVNLYTVRLYQQRGEMEYVSVFKLREPTESIMESGDTRDGECYASKGKIRHHGTELFLYDQENGGSSKDTYPESLRDFDRIYCAVDTPFGKQSAGMIQLSTLGNSQVVRMRKSWGGTCMFKD